jgi:UDP-N-acetylmuramate dehydrogenase
VGVRAVLRDGRLVELAPEDLDLGYRRSALPRGAVVIEATFEGARADPAALAAKMDEQVARRDASQPTRDRSAGSTFRNPAGFSSTGRSDDSHELKAWKLIADAGLRGATIGGAQMSPKHPNFLVNTGQASAYELESLGETVRKRVYAASGLRLEWEIRRVGLPGPEGPVADAFET